MAELFDLYNEKLEPLGETVERGDRIPAGKYHIVIAVLSVNFENKVLITRRDDRKPYGGLWEMTQGAVIAGETPVQGALRELKEETGLRALPDLKVLQVLKDQRVLRGPRVLRNQRVLRDQQDLSDRKGLQDPQFQPVSPPPP